MTDWLLLILLLFAANLPWFSHKLFYVLPLKRNGLSLANKHIGWCLLELVILYFMMGMVARYAEQSIYGQVATQGWEFYAVTACIFLVFAFPGFVYRTLWKSTL
ncbi:MAG: DUF2818 family protein [Betaproteobacteria bacterium]|nr:DUF2818 family protein [Betaproteobacteria bacterium]